MHVYTVFKKNMLFVFIYMQHTLTVHTLTALECNVIVIIVSLTILFNLSPTDYLFFLPN